MFSSEIFPSLLCCRKEFLLDNLRRGRPFSHEGEFEVVDKFQIVQPLFLKASIEDDIGEDI